MEGVKREGVRMDQVSHHGWIYLYFTSETNVVIHRQQHNGPGLQVMETQPLYRLKVV